MRGGGGEGTARCPEWTQSHTPQQLQPLTHSPLPPPRLPRPQNPLAVQPHLRKCFEAISSLDFGQGLQISGMNSQEGEKVGLGGGGAAG